MRQTGDMRLPRPSLRRGDVPIDFGKGLATPKQARRALAKALKANTRHSARAGEPSTPVCLVGRARQGADYTKQRHYWVRRARGWSAQGWPQRLPRERYAMFVCPLSPAAAAQVLEHPKPIAVPAFIQFDLRLPPESALALVASVWLAKEAVADFDAVALAPPVLERYLGGRCASRETVDYDLEWQLPAVL